MTATRASAPTSRVKVVYLPSPWLGVTALLALVIGVPALAALAFRLWLATAPAEVRVPDIIGINQRAAEEILSRRGLVGQVVGRRYHDQVPAGTVLSAVPPAGKMVRQGRIVEMVLSDGPRWTTMPDVREMQLQRATEAIAAADLHLSRIRRRYNDTIPSGSVIRQNPDAGARVPRRGEVELTVSAGPKPEVEPAETPNRNDTTQPDLGPARYATVEVRLPEGENRNLVRIEVEDRRGTTVAYSEFHDPGSTVTRVVTGYGDATARVYVDGALIEEKKF
jgi:serine/threonine-protein kinase